jgi:hypothetical protein
MAALLAVLRADWRRRRFRHFEGRRLTGRVNRITKRATVLVEDSEGQKYSDGLRYKTYYVPIADLCP